MFKNRSRTAVASFDKKIEGFHPFIVIIGGSDEYTALDTCELYYPKTDCYYAFPTLNIARENASVCVMHNCCKGGYSYIYILGGFNKKAVD